MRRKLLIVSVSSILSVIIVSFVVNCPTFASDGIVETTFFGNLQDDGNGCGVYTILNLIVDIMTIGIGILAAIGITIVGIKYLTAKGNEEQTRKAKHRMFEIVIGLVAYALMYAGIQWLLPGGKLNTTSCTKLSDAEVATIRAEEKAEKAEKEKENSSSGSNSSGSNSGSNSKYYKNCMSNAVIKDKNVRNKICEAGTASERIARTAELLAAPSKKKSIQCYSLTWKPTKWGQFKKCKPTEYFQYAYDKVRPDHWKYYSNSVKNVIRTGASCDIFVGTVVAASGYDKVQFSHDKIRNKITSHKTKWKKVSKAKRGDICQKYFGGGNAHIKIFLGNNKIAEASSGLSSGDKRWGGVTSGNCSGYTIYRAIEY